MSSLARKSLIARLACETLEDRVNPVVGYTLSGIANGAANLLSFDTTTPTVTQTTAITGIATNEQLVGLDFRPQNGHLYALGVTTTSASTNTGTLYDISTRTGRATPVGGANGLVTVTNGGGLSNPTTTNYAFDFNPVADAIRVMATDGDNFVINANSGTTIVEQTAVGGGRVYSGTAYTNNAPNQDSTVTPVTTEFAIDTTVDVLYRLPTPATPGPGDVIVGTSLGVDASSINGFDIPTGVNSSALGGAVTSTVTTAFAILNVGGMSRLYTVNLAETGAGSGTATLVGTVGNGAAVNGLAIQNDLGSFPAIGMTGATAGSAALVRLSTATPGTTSATVTVTIDAAEFLAGIAFRPATGQLYGLGVNSTTGDGTLYIINPQSSGTATVVGTVGGVSLDAINGRTPTNLPDPVATGYGFGFNATVDAIRVVTANGESFAIAVNGVAAGTVAARAPLVSGGNVSGVSYTNAFGQGTGGPTTLYVLDAATNRLATMNPGTSVVGAGVPITLNGAPLNFTDANGFEIAAGVTTVGPNGTPVQAGVGYALLTVSGVTNLYRINLTNGVATDLGTNPSTFVDGLALADAPGGTVQFQSASVSGNEGGSVSIVLTRNTTTGPQTVSVTATGGNGTAGSDIAATPFLVTFPDGATTATLTIPLTADQLTEGAESIVLTLSVPGGARGTQFTTIINIADTSTTPPPPPPFYSGATVVGGNLVLAGAGVSGGQQIVPLPPGSNAIFADLSGDGVQDLIIITPSLAVVQDGATGRFLALAADVTGDGVRDLLIFNANGTTTTTNGRTGITVTQ